MAEQLGCREEGEFQRGWRVLLASFIGMVVQPAAYFSLGTMMTPLIHEFGWSRAQIVGVGALSAVLSIFIAPFVGALLNRYGPRRVALIGFATYPLAIASAALVGPRIEGWWLVWLFIAASCFFCGTMVSAYAVTNSFARHRGLAIGIVQSGSGVANFIIPVFLAVATGVLGWRGAYLALGAFVFLVGGGFTLAFLHMPSARIPARGEAPSTEGLEAAGGATLAEAIRTRRYWQLCLAVFIVSAVIGALVVHLQPILIDAGATMIGAALITSTIGPAQIVGRLLGGWLLDHVSGPIVGVAAAFLPLVSCALLLAGQGAGLAALAIPVCIGLAAGLVLNLATYLASRYFGSRHFGSTFSMIFSAYTIGYTSGPLLAALGRDMIGNYFGVLIALSLACPAATLAVATLGRYPEKVPATSLD
jgi:MFS family permease